MRTWYVALGTLAVLTLVLSSCTGLPTVQNGSGTSLSGATGTTVTITGNTTSGSITPTVDTNKVVSLGSIISVDYTLRISSGGTDVIFDTSRQSDAMKMAGGIRSGAVFQPLTFPVGAGKMIPGFDKEVQGMKIGESKSFVVSPEEGYGPAYKSEWVPRDAFEAIVSKKIPKVEVTEVPVAFWTSNNKPLPKVGEQVSDGGTVGKVLSVSNSSVTVSVENNLATVFGTGFQKVWDTATVRGNTVTLKSMDAEGWTVEMDNSKSPFVGKPIVPGTKDVIKMETMTGTTNINAVIEKVQTWQVLLGYPDVPNDHPLAGKTLKFDVTVVDIQ